MKVAYDLDVIEKIESMKVIEILEMKVSDPNFKYLLSELSEEELKIAKNTMGGVTGTKRKIRMIEKLLEDYHPKEKITFTGWCSKKDFIIEWECMQYIFKMYRKGKLRFE